MHLVTVTAYLLCPQFFEQAIVEIINPGMNLQILAALPGILNDGGVANIVRLFEDIELTEPTKAVLEIFDPI